MLRLLPLLPFVSLPAAGFALPVFGKWIFVIPGVPAEARMMLTQGVIPVLRKNFPQNDQYAAKQTIKTYGLSEAAVDEKLKDIDLLPRLQYKFFLIRDLATLFSKRDDDDEACIIRGSGQTTWTTKAAARENADMMARIINEPTLVE